MEIDTDTDTDESIFSCDSNELQSFGFMDLNSDIESIEYECDSWLENLSIDDAIEIENMTYDLIGEYIQNEIQTMCLYNFYKNMKNSIFLLLEEQLLESGIYTEENSEELQQYVNDLCDSFFQNNNIHPRSYIGTHILQPLTISEKNKIQQKIEFLKNVIQPKQKTEEWYKVRNGLLTASNIWKVFASEAQQNSLIYEKCNPKVDFFQNTNIYSTLHWGNKYEPLSCMVYEKMYQTKVNEFGCIIHEKYPFIGASPDGININENTDRYGRMIEIKNIVNREITGIPKDEYWIQMQIQMETCDLDECDFIETRFKEYPDKEAFYLNDTNREHRGVILYFSHVLQNNIYKNQPHYVFMDLDVPLEKEKIDEWIHKKKEELKPEYFLYEIQYWYLDEISVVLVNRNQEWFQSVVPKIENIWNIIEKERVEGYEHRNVKKKINKMEVLNDENSTNKIIHNMQNTNNVCLIKLDEK